MDFASNWSRYAYEYHVLPEALLNHLPQSKRSLASTKRSLDSRDLDKQRLSEAELDTLIGDRDYKQFLNARNELYRKRKMKDHPPSRSEAIELMVKEPKSYPPPLAGSWGTYHLWLRRIRVPQAWLLTGQMPESLWT